MKPKWDKAKLADEIAAMAHGMAGVAARMLEHDGEIREHGMELSRASRQAMTWADGIQGSA